MYYIISVYDHGNGYSAKVYNFSFFTPFEWIIDGTLDLSVANDWTNAYSDLYPEQFDDNIVRLINKVADIIVDEGYGLGKWIGAFYNGKYDQDLTYEINNDKAILIFDKNELEHRRRKNSR